MLDIISAFAEHGSHAAHANTTRSLLSLKKEDKCRMQIQRARLEQETSPPYTATNFISCIGILELVAH